MILEPKQFIALHNRYTSGEDVLAQLLALLLPLAEATASSFSDDSQFREDLIQDCMERAAQSMTKYNPQLAIPYNYFTSVFRNMCISSLESYTEKRVVDVEIAASYQDNIQDGSTLTELLCHNRERFPSIPAERLDKLTVHAYTYILDGAQPGNGKGIVGDAKKAGYSHTEAMSVYYASLIWLRNRYIYATYYSYKQPSEFSIMSDLVALVGEEMYETLCIVFAGMKLQFPKN